MKPIINTLDFVYEVMQRLDDAQIATWLCGGWAEELWGICAPRQHRDVDLLYPASDFHRLDQWTTSTNDVSLIQGKHFSHKRAFVYKTIVVELCLLESYTDGYITNYFDDRYTLFLPDDTLSSLIVNGCSAPIASKQALYLYRQNHSFVDEAYRAYFKGRE